MQYFNKILCVRISSCPYRQETGPSDFSHLRLNQNLHHSMNFAVTEIHASLMVQEGEHGGCGHIPQPRQRPTPGCSATAVNMFY